MEFTQDDMVYNNHEGTGESRYRSYYSDLSQVKEEWLDEEMQSLTARYEEISSEKQRRKAIRVGNSQTFTGPQGWDSSHSASATFINDDNSHKDTDIQLQADISRALPAQVTRENIIGISGSTDSDNNLQETVPGNPRNRNYPPAVSNDSDGTHYHMNTRTLREGGPAAPYGDLPEEEFYAPGITIERYKTLCSTFCGIVMASRVKEGAKPHQPVRSGSLVDTGKIFRCIICDASFNSMRHVEAHFPACVKINGNPHGFHVSSRLPSMSEQASDGLSGLIPQTFSPIEICRESGTNEFTSSE